MKYPLISAAVIYASLGFHPPAFGSIYADLFERTVTGKNNGSPFLEITNGTRIIQTTDNNAKIPPGMQDLGPNEKITVPMTRAGFAYYMNKYQQLKEGEKIRGRSQSLPSMSSSPRFTSQCPPGKRIFQRTVLFGLIKGEKLCLSDFEAEKLKQDQARITQDNVNDINRQYTLDQIERNTRTPAFTLPRIVTCSSEAFGNYRSTTCF